MSQEADTWDDLYDTLKKNAKEAKLQLEAFCGKESAKKTLKKREEDKVIAQYFGDKVYKHLPETKLREYSRKVLEYQNGGYEKNARDYFIRSYTGHVRSFASKAKFDDDHQIGKSSASLAAFKKVGPKGWETYKEIQEYASFGMENAIADIGKPVLEKMDKAIEESLDPKDLAEFRKQYGGKSFTEIYDKYYNPQYANKQKKSLETYQGNRTAGSYR